MKQRLLTLLLGCWLAIGAVAATFETTDGQTLMGEPVGFSNRGLVMKQPDGTYSAATPWAQMSQATLKELRDNPRAARFVEPFIRITEEEKTKLSGLTLADVPRLERPTGHVGIIGMLFSSGLGWLLVLLIYMGNLFAAYEVALYRAYSPQAVCGAAALLPWITQALLLAVPREKLVGAIGAKGGPTKPSDEEANQEAAPEAEASGHAAWAAEPTVLPPGEVFEDVALPPEAHTPLLPETVTFSRGVVTFNRRFFETKMAKFRKIVPEEDAKDFVLVFKTSRGNHTTRHITKLEQNEVYIQVAKGNATEDVKVPFLEIYEVQLKHKDLA